MIKQNKRFPSLLQAIAFVVIFIPLLQIGSTLLSINLPVSDSVGRVIGYSLGIFLSFLLLYLLTKWKNKSCQFSFKVTNWKLIPSMIILALLLTILEVIIVIAFANQFPSLAQQRGNNVTFIYFLQSIIVAPIFEELIFRGIILDNFLKRYSTRIAIFMSAFLFGIIHFNWIYIPLLTASFYIVGWIYSRTKSLLHSIIYHASANFFSVGLVYYITNYIFNIESFSPSTAEGLNKSEILVLASMFLISAILLVICLRFINKLLHQLIP